MVCYRTVVKKMEYILVTNAKHDHISMNPFLLSNFRKEEGFTEEDER
jgi:hypothetical protein